MSKDFRGVYSTLSLTYLCKVLRYEYRWSYSFTCHQTRAIPACTARHRASLPIGWYYRQRDGQAELTCVHTHPVTHPCTNRSRRRATSLTLLLSEATNLLTFLSIASCYFNILIIHVIEVDCLQNSALVHYRQTRSHCMQCVTQFQWQAACG